MGKYVDDICVSFKDDPAQKAQRIARLMVNDLNRAEAEIVDNAFIETTRQMLRVYAEAMDGLADKLQPHAVDYVLSGALKNLHALQDYILECTLMSAMLNGTVMRVMSENGSLDCPCEVCTAARMLQQSHGGSVH